MLIKDLMSKNFFLNKLLGSLPYKELSKLDLVTYNPGEEILKENTVPDKVVIIVEGFCSVTRPVSHGYLEVIYKVEGVDIIGFTEILNGDNAYLATVSADIRTKAIVIPRELFWSWLDSYPSFSIEIIRILSSRLHKVVELQNEYLNNPAYNRVVRYFVNNYKACIEQSGLALKTVEFTESRKELSYIMGLNIRTINRVLKELKDEGLIDIKSGNIYISEIQLEKLKLIT